MESGRRHRLQRGCPDDGPRRVPECGQGALEQRAQHVRHRRSHLHHGLPVGAVERSAGDRDAEELEAAAAATQHGRQGGGRRTRDREPRPAAEPRAGTGREPLHHHRQRWERRRDPEGHARLSRALRAYTEPVRIARMTIHYEADGPVAVVTIDRPEVANAIDRPTADALADAFRRFDADVDVSVAVLTGSNGTFCAGADLKAMRQPDASRVTRVEPDGDGPVGPTRMLLGKPVIAAVEGHAVAGGLESRPGAICAWRPRTPSSGSTAGAGASRSWTAAPCAWPG